MKKQWKKWSNEEIELLKIHWKSSNMETLLKQFPNRNYNSLMNKAVEIGVKSESQRKRKGSFDFLDTITTNSAFWWGFIMADGYLSPRGELNITIHNKDTKYLEVLANKLNVRLKFYKQFTRLAMQSQIFGKKWLKIFNINSPKTYIPPNLDIFYNEKYLLPFIIGFIDGDGCIWESKNWLNLRIELHGNWFNTLNDISNNLKKFYDIDCKVKITKRGTSKLDINTKKDLRIIKDYNNLHNISHMSRKWSKLDSL